MVPAESPGLRTASAPVSPPQRTASNPSSISFSPPQLFYPGKSPWAPFFKAAGDPAGAISPTVGGVPQCQHRQRSKRQSPSRECGFRTGDSGFRASELPSLGTRAPNPESRLCSPPFASLFSLRSSLAVVQYGPLQMSGDVARPLSRAAAGRRTSRARAGRTTFARSRLKSESLCSILPN